MFVKIGDDPKAKILHVITAEELDVPVEQAVEQYKKATQSNEDEDELHKEVR